MNGLGNWTVDYCIQFRLLFIIHVLVVYLNMYVIFLQFRSTTLSRGETILNYIFFFVNINTSLNFLAYRGKFTLILHQSAPTNLKVTKVKYKKA
jgi:hypothetical protein